MAKSLSISCEVELGFKDSGLFSSKVYTVRSHLGKDKEAQVLTCTEVYLPLQRDYTESDTFR